MFIIFIDFFIYLCLSLGLCFASFVFLFSFDYLFILPLSLNVLFDIIFELCVDCVVYFCCCYISLVYIYAFSERNFV